MKKSWLQQFKRKPKAERTDKDDNTFDSKSELKVWKQLQLQEQSGLIHGLEKQVAYPLVLPDGTPVKTPTGRTARYTADFVYWRGDEEIIADVKGFASEVSKLRISIFEAIYKKKVTIIKV